MLEGPEGEKRSPDVIGAGTISEDRMAARLGQRFYWAACGITALITLFLMCGPAIERPAAIMMMGAAGAIWLIGQACRNLLAGR
jgi:hypothetical protein